MQLSSTGRTAGAPAAHQRVAMLFMVPLLAIGLHHCPIVPARVWPVVPALLGLVLLWRRRRAGAWFLLAALAGWLLIWQINTAMERRLTPVMEGVDYALEGTVSSLVNRFENGIRFNFRVEGCARAQAHCPHGRQVRLSWYGGAPDELMPGQRWLLNVRLKRPHSVINPLGFDGELLALQRGLDGLGYVRSPSKRASSEPAGRKYQRNQRLVGKRAFTLGMIANLREQVQRAMQAALVQQTEPTRGTLVALVTGNQDAIPTDTWELYNRTGTGHLMSISGLHVTMFAALAMTACRLLLRYVRPVPVRLLLNVPAPVIGWVAGVLAAFAYSAFSGWGIPAQRTSWMLAVAGAVMLSGRGCNVPVILAMAAAVITALDPWAPMNAGFWLSFVAVAAIILIAHGAQHGLASPTWVPSWLREAVRTQWAATLSLLPLSAFWFGSVSLIGPLANAVAIPLVSAVITPLAMLGGLIAVIWPLGGSWLLILGAKACDGLLWLMSWCSDLPNALLITGVPGWLAMVSAIAGATLLLMPGAPLPRVYALGLLAPMLLLPGNSAAPGHWSVLAFDVGQGTAVLVQTANHVLLYDTGPHYGADSGAGERVVAPLLRARRIRRLDKLIVSHQDRDHSGGAQSLLNRFQVQELMTSIEGDHALRNTAIQTVSCERGQAWQWDGVSFEILHPGVTQVTRAKSRSNARSCVLKIQGPGGAVLLTGDIEAAQEKLLTQLFNGSGLRADVLIVPHHGSNTSSSEQFLERVAPTYAVFQVGYRNRFQHPAKKVLARYRHRAIDILRSDRDGAIEVEFGAGHGPRVTRYRHRNRRYWRIG